MSEPVCTDCRDGIFALGWLLWMIVWCIFMLAYLPCMGCWACYTFVRDRVVVWQNIPRPTDDEVGLISCEFIENTSSSRGAQHIAARGLNF